MSFRSSVFLLGLSQSGFSAWAFAVRGWQINFCVHEDTFNLIDFQLSTADTIRFQSHAGGRRQLTFTSNSDVSTRNLYCTNMDRRKPSLSRLHHKRPKSRTNTQAQTLNLHHRRRSRQSRTNCPSCRRRRETSRSRQQQSTKTMTPLHPHAVRARLPLRLLPRILCIRKVPRLCTRRRMLSPCAK